MPYARVSDPAFIERLRGAGLTTAEILYRMPDHPALLQTFSWQFEDTAPNYPRLRRFLDYWEREIEAKIHSVRVMHSRLIKPQEIHCLAEIGYLN
ncbi:usg protein [Aureimonas jatrophae]|uniref:Uncharacterized protein n=1 Tax=Aureimonas jatrophae TaxID=1166073 RepID=A0A1H0JLB7_9HYPH|nr:hypothetical protein [Aureimonas jatrophae]MBB3951358.1 uncharacterized protein Usg [Aureimonas jatrophae]SDO44171.1 Usg protein (tryptophan operon, function unknown) [Aureimonas jatrophae]